MIPAARARALALQAAATVLLLVVVQPQPAAQAKTVCVNFINKCTTVSYLLAGAARMSDGRVMTGGWWPLPPGNGSAVCHSLQQELAADGISYHAVAVQPQGAVTSNTTPWDGSKDGDYCILMKKSGFEMEDAHARSCAGNGERRVAFHRTEAATNVISACTVCTKIVNRCAAHAYDVMFAVPAIDGKFRTDGWLRVPANGELTTCWTTQAGMAERRVAMHVEAAGPAKVDSVLKPTFPVNWPGRNSAKAALCVNFGNPAMTTSAACSGKNEMLMNFWYMESTGSLMIEQCSNSAGTTAAVQAAPPPRAQEEPSVQVTPSPPAPDAWLRFMPSSTGTRCRDLGLARTYALVNPRRTSTAVVNCPRSIKVLIKPNCWVQVHQEDGYVLRQVYYAPGEPNKWQGEFVFVRDSVGEQATWPGRGGPPPQLPDVREGCVDRDDRKVRVGYWLSTLDGWGT